MPTRRLRLTQAEQEEYRTRLLRLNRIGVVTGGTIDLPPQPKRFILEQVDCEFARVYDLPGDRIAVVTPANLTVLKSGVMITDAQMSVPWPDGGLGLSWPEEGDWFADELVRGLPSLPPTMLNDLLVGRRAPLRRGQQEGIIIATGWSGVPPSYQDEMQIVVGLWLRDERRCEFRCDFKARVDRSLKRKYERRRPDPRELAERLASRGSLFEPEKAPPSAQQVTGVGAKREPSKIGIPDELIHRKAT
jgi:hypothetical protein